MAAVELTVFHVILLFWSVRTAESQVMVMTLSGCESYCGGIAIPYPFGMTKGCFLDERFKIHCNSSSGVPKLTLNGTDLAVIYISVSYSTIYVMFPIFFANCGVKDRSTVVDLEGSPFVFSSEDDFVARGCNNLTLTNQNNSTIGGCVSICYENRDRLIASCSGINSCQTRDPSDMIDGDSALVVVLDWGIDRRVFESLVKNGSYNTLSYTSTCKNMNTSINSTIQSPIVQCSCNPDFEGNPYLSGICQGKLRILLARFTIVLLTDPSTRWFFQCVAEDTTYVSYRRKIKAKMAGLEIEYDRKEVMGATWDVTSPSTISSFGSSASSSPDEKPLFHTY
ncbi:hypothetical protein SADUNF_Sadunf18G0059800 [Salix dunnii]|uniref:Wall-associated receptor kinase galacturonan-binding domain-containing protein n=1 Tax=Salix dunnii TaxID=1413687 RepID=A0A835J3L5_9ROSI|nr:hypothetical protein SADUNF_Sadunf18G0059800 [Salix dunnii]